MKQNGNGLVLDVHERPTTLKWILLSLQHVFAMFGATVLVPILTGLPIAVALVASGVGTLIYIAVTKAKVPVYLGSSFAYIAAIAAAGQHLGYGAAYYGLLLVGIIYVAVAVLIHFVGKRWLEVALPPVVIGPMIAIIGLGLANVAIGQSGMAPNHPDAFLASLASDWKNPLIAVVTFLITVGVALFSKGFFKVIPFIIGIFGGYIFAVILGVVNLREVFDGTFFSMPGFQFIGTYAPDFRALLMFAPIAFVTIAEHIGDHTVLGHITGKDFLKDPGIERTLIGDGVATAVSAMIGGPANTTYGENTGVVAMTKVASVWVTGLAAVFAILLGFIAPINQFIASIPNPVMGGISIVLFGLIAANGLKVLSKGNVDMNNMRNIIIIAAMLIIGLGGAEIVLTRDVTGNAVGILEKMALAAIVGITLNLIFKAIPEKASDK